MYKYVLAEDTDEAVKDIIKTMTDFEKLENFKKVKENEEDENKVNEDKEKEVEEKEVEEKEVEEKEVEEKEAEEKEVEEKEVEEKEVEEKGYPISPICLCIENLVTDGCKQIVLTGAPGTGKTYSAKEYVKWKLELLETPKKLKKNEQFEMVQFHPSYDYTDFVEGLRPANINGTMQFVRMDGIFKAFCRKAVKDPNDKYYFVIDEINRADLAKVFGELMYCLEEGYRGEEHGINTQYKNLPTYEPVKATDAKSDTAKPLENDIFAEKFYIPENVIIIGTMNDIDRSVDTFDFALRRRFRWINVKVNEILLRFSFESMKKKHGLKDYASDDIDIKRIMDMNKVFESYEQIFRTPGDYYVGAAYFEGLFKGESMNTIWGNKVEPLLREYVRGREIADEFIKKCKDELLDKKDETNKVDEKLAKNIFDEISKKLNANKLLKGKVKEKISFTKKLKNLIIKQMRKDDPDKYLEIGNTFIERPNDLNENEKESIKEIVGDTITKEKQKMDDLKQGTEDVEEEIN